ncbi:MAG: hypothetical protein LBC77_02635 [Spirochaetaceae bacterium]|jgi:Na+-transporting NADH:ubiquinone oxidoreductase subunit NqrD|nr:hypothetical protein [Spirochaetaceae bacterium]
MIKKLAAGFTGFYGKPANIMTCAALIIFGTSRLAFAICAAAALVWGYVFSVTLIHSSKRFFPKSVFNNILSLCVFGFAAGLFQLFMELACPALAMETALIVLIVPALCFVGNIERRTERSPLLSAVTSAVLEAAGIGVFLVAFALIREPLGYGSLSLPGGLKGYYEIFSVDKSGFPVRIISAPAGALLLSGYIFIVFKMIKPAAKKEEK